MNDNPVDCQNPSVTEPQREDVPLWVQGETLHRFPLLRAVYKYIKYILFIAEAVVGGVGAVEKRIFASPACLFAPEFSTGIFSSAVESFWKILSFRRKICRAASISQNRGNFPKDFKGGKGKPFPQVQEFSLEYPWRCSVSACFVETVFQGKYFPCRLGKMDFPRLFPNGFLFFRTYFPQGFPHLVENWRWDVEK